MAVDLIIGGGFAGLASAVALTEAGRRVLVFERRSFLGGRAYSFIDRATGESVDNGQHLMMGCYHATFDFLNRIGALEKLRFQSSPRVDFLDDRGGLASFRCPPLPAPLHLFGGLCRLRTIGWRDRLMALRVGLAARRSRKKRPDLSALTVREWLTGLGQSTAAQRRFWDPLALATLNEAPERASADMLARVLEEGFLGRRRDSRLAFSRVGLSDLYTGDARRFIEARGGELRLQAEVERIEFDGLRVKGIALRSGERIAARTVVSAVPPQALARLLPAEIRERDPACAGLDRFESSPIVSVNLWYEEPITELEFVGLLDSRIDWVFNRSAITGSNGCGQQLALVTSGARSTARLAKEELIELAISEMRRFFPRARGARLRHATVVREHEATISHTVGVARMRPPARTSIAGLYLAGDWTATGLPATIESAVRSGYKCAESILQNS